MTELEAIEMYRDFLDTTYDPVVIGDLEYSPSRVLELVDPTAFRCGLNDYMDAHGFEID